MSAQVVPVTQRVAKEFISEHHRHHAPPVGWLWGHGLIDGGGNLVGCATVGRPVARSLDDGLTCEVTRLCTNGISNGCSMLYAAARRTAIAKGYRRGLTYTLASEAGTSLKASGWTKLWITKGRSWSCPSRPRQDKHPLEDKVAWGWGAWA